MALWQTKQGMFGFLQKLMLGLESGMMGGKSKNVNFSVYLAFGGDIRKRLIYLLAVLESIAHETI